MLGPFPMVSETGTGLAWRGDRGQQFPYIGLLYELIAPSPPPSTSYPSHSPLYTIPPLRKGASSLKPPRCATAWGFRGCCATMLCNSTAGMLCNHLRDPHAVQQPSCLNATLQRRHMFEACLRHIHIPLLTISLSLTTSLSLTISSHRYGGKGPTPSLPKPHSCLNCQAKQSLQSLSR